MLVYSLSNKKLNNFLHKSFIKNGEVIIKEKQLPAKPFKVGKLDSYIANTRNFMTIDIETVMVENKQTPYLICGYSQGNYIVSQAKDSSINSINQMFSDFINKILENEDIKYVYAHNLSGFDGILLMKHLINYDGIKVSPKIFNGKIISIDIKYNDKYIAIKDSLLLLPNSLRSLCKSFSVPTAKGHFPFLLTDINYNGEFPSFYLFNKITQTEYDLIRKEHGNSTWSFMSEAIKYCHIDCKALF